MDSRGIDNQHLTPMENKIFDTLQQKVIDIDSGRHLVLAPPGCGKTAILAERTFQALRHGISPAEMLCLTFTNRASRGMQSRIEQRSAEHATEIFIGNTHRFCGRYLFDNQAVKGNTGILDETDAMSVMLEIAGISGNEDNLTYSQSTLLITAIRLQHILHQFRHRHHNNILLRIDQEEITALRELCHEMKYDFTRTAIIDIFDHIDDVKAQLGDTPFHGAIIEKLRLARLYAGYKRDNDLIDFDDMLLLTYDALRADTAHQRYRWIQVDEVQDLNPMQLAIIEELAEPDGVVLYLGDEQQSIFSFIGAKMSTLNKLKEICGDNIHLLGTNYRSPRYLLDIFNTYASRNFDIDPDMLPQACNESTAGEHDLAILTSLNNETALADAATIACRFPKSESTAIIVPTNRDADAVSEALGNTPHFKISGVDLFASAPMEFIISHLTVVSRDSSPLAWSKILKNLNLVRSDRTARRAVQKLFAAAISPSDFLTYPEGESYLTDFTSCYASRSIVIFDTETTGLNVFADDIVQIAAVKIERGHITGKLNLVMETSKAIPEMLGDLVNPLVEYYRSADKATRHDGLTRFLDFARGAVVMGHNLDFDFNILKQNLLSQGIATDLDSFMPKRFDTLRLARLMYPRMYSYRLKDLLAALGLEGENSHLADDDIMATKSLTDKIFADAVKPEFMNRHREILVSASAAMGKLLNDLYGGLYRDTLSRMYLPGHPDAMVSEVEIAEKWLIDKGFLAEPIAKLKYVTRYLGTQIPPEATALVEQLQSTLIDFQTYREADLCENSMIDEHIVVTTVHKAKGLEFDNVIVYGPVDGTYPFFKSDTRESQREDARKLYVALTRARHRLWLLSYSQYLATTSYGTRRFDKAISPFLLPVIGLFNEISAKTLRHNRPSEDKC